MIEIEAEPIEKIDVMLVGKSYKVKPPKTAMAMKIAVRAKTAMDDPTQVVDILNEWIVKAFGTKDAEKIQKRFEDENDNLDVTHVMELIEKIIEAQTGEKPTT